jgi:hypothetical protein
MEAIEHEDGRRRRPSDNEVFKRVAVRTFAEVKYSFRAAAMAVNLSEQSLRVWHAKCTPSRRPGASTPRWRS